MGRIGKFTRLTVGAAIIASPALVHAQSADQTAKATGDALGGDIVVTARKRQEKLQDTPISISAFSATSLAARGVQTTDSLAQITPNLTLQNNPGFGGSSNSAAIYIRGVGQQDFLPTVDPGVGVYVDGVYIARSVGAILDLLDFDRIEVLRGPQGTLFGRNTIGGAISITSKAPTSNTEAAISVTGGTDNMLTAKAMINAALADNLFVRISAGRMYQDGYVLRPYDGEKLGDTNKWVGRISVRYDAAPNLRFDLSIDGTTARETGPAVSLLGFAYGFTKASPPFIDIQNTLANLAAGGPAAPCATAANPINLAVPGCVDNRYIVGPNENMGTAPSYSDSGIWGSSLTGEWTVSSNLTVKSITAYRHLKSDFARDGDDTPAAVTAYTDNLVQNQISQEVQLLGNNFGNRLKWILGAYGFRESGNDANYLNFNVSNFLSGGYFANSSLALFGQGSFAITTNLTLTAGLRYTHDRKEFEPNQYIIQNNLPTLPPFTAPFFAAGTPVLPHVLASESFNEATPMVNLAWKATPDTLLYASYSKGYKSGGFTQRVFPPIVYPYTTNNPDPVQEIPSFQPEKVDAFEAGVKWTQGPLRFNLAGFYSKYTNQQIQVFTSVAPVFENAASSHIDGFEAETQLKPGDGWFAEFAAGMTNAHYDSIDEATTFVSPSNQFERISKWTLSGGVQKTIGLGTYGTLTPRVDWAYRSKFFNDAYNTPQIAQAGYSVYNANITWRSTNDKYSVSLAGKDLFDKRFLLSGVYGDAFQTYEGVYNRGREVMLTASARY